MHIEYICWRCVGDDYLKKEIKERRRVNVCSLCSRNARCYSFVELVNRVDEVFKEYFIHAEEITRFLFEDDTNDAFSEQDGKTTEQVVIELIDCHHKVAEEIAEKLEERESYDVLKNGENGFYFGEKIFVERSIYPYYLLEIWEEFCSEVKHQHRFLSPNVLKYLNDIFGDISVLQLNYNNQLIHTIESDGEQCIIFRARSTDDIHKAIKMHECPEEKLSPPPKEKATPGRMNPAGIPVFYGSFESGTCLSEVRPYVGEWVIIGEFKIIKPLKILDLTVLDEPVPIMSYFHPSYKDIMQLIYFMKYFHMEVQKPILPKDEALDYLPTQVVSEYLANPNQFHPMVDGIIFNSSQSDGKNITLFNYNIENKDNSEKDTEEDKTKLNVDEINQIIHKSVVNNKLIRLFVEDDVDIEPVLKVNNENVKIQKVTSINIQSTEYTTDLDFFEDLSTFTPEL